MSNHTTKVAKSNPSVNWRTGLTDNRVSEVNSEQPSIDEQIRVRAYELYMERGAQPHDDLADWLQAERELRQDGGVEVPGAAS